MSENRIYINRIKEILEERRIEEIRPTDEVLHKMNATIHLWYRWVRKKADPELYQLFMIADFLDVPVLDLIVQKTAVEA